MGATGPVGCAIGAVRVKRGTPYGGVASGYVVGAMGPVGYAAGAMRAKGGTVFGETAVGATEPVGGALGTGHRLMCARWRSTAVIAAAVTASTIWFKEGGGSASEAFTILELGVREGRRCVIRSLNICGGNDSVSLSCSAAWNITGGTCRRSCPVCRGCGPKSRSEPERVARFGFPRPLEGSSRRRWLVVAEESLVEESIRLVRFASILRSVWRSHCAPSVVVQASSRRSRRRRVAFTTRSLRKVRSCVARSSASSGPKRFLVSSNRVSWTSFAWSLMGARRADGNSLLRNMNFETGSSR